MNGSLSRRGAGRVFLAGLAALSSQACAGLLPYDLQPGSLKKGSRMLAFQAASIAYSFSSSHAAQWKGTLDRLRRDVPPLMNAAREADHAMQLLVTPRLSNPGKVGVDHTEYYDVDLAVVAGAKPAAAGAKGKGAALPKAVVVRGRAGTDERAYDAMEQAAAKTLGLQPGLLRGGHFALYALINMCTAFNVSHDGLQRHAFSLLVLREKIRNGEKADWAGANRPPDETLQDIEVALRVIAEHHALTSRWRSEVLGVVALFNGYKVPDGARLFGEQIDESAGRNDRWVAEHQRPTPDDFGVAMNELKLPTPEVLLERLDESGYVSAAVTIAKGLATGSVGTTLEGVAKLAPKDGSARLVLEGIAASSRGDIEGAARSAVKLVGKVDSGVGARLEKLQAAVGSIRGGAAQVASALGKPPTDLDGLRQAASDLAEGAGKVERGATVRP